MALIKKKPGFIQPWFGTKNDDERAGTDSDDFLVGMRGDDTLMGMGGDDVLNGQKGADVMFGGAGQDQIYTSGDDIAWGGKGSDVFIFLDIDRLPDVTDAGTATVMDFDATSPVHDKIDISNFGTNWASRDAGLEDGFEMVKNGSDVVIRLKGEGGSITRIVLQDTRLSDLHEGDFLFG